MPSARARTRPPRNATRAAVLACAQELFLEKGYHRTTVDGIASAAGFSRGAVYSSFSNKEQLFLALLRMRMLAQAEQISTDVAGAPAGAPRARVAGGALAVFAEAEPGWTPLLMEFWAYALRDPALTPQLMALRRELRDAGASLVRLVRGPAPQGSLSDSGLALLIFALSNGVGMEWATDPDARDRSLLRDAIERLLLGA